jgi:uncharacterized protein
MRRAEPRLYREHMGEGRFKTFSVQYKDSDLWIGIDPESFRDRVPGFAMKQLIIIRNELEQYLSIHPAFATSFKPLSCRAGAPAMAVAMASAAQIALTGPMAAVAGAFAEYIGRAIQREFSVKEVVVENGGDIYLSIIHPLTIAVYAGKSPLSGKVGIEIPPEASPLGICTSAGTVGPSVSFGKADAVMVACKNTLLADALATAYGNKVKTASDIGTTIETAGNFILSLVIICEGQIGISGSYPIKPLTAPDFNNEK